VKYSSDTRGIETNNVLEQRNMMQMIRRHRLCVFFVSFASAGSLPAVNAIGPVLSVVFSLGCLVRKGYLVEQKDRIDLPLVVVGKQ
jgi:hypothetical protein